MTPVTPNEKAAAVTSCDGLDFCWTTTASPHAKEDTDDKVYHIPAPFKRSR